MLRVRTSMSATGTVFGNYNEEECSLHFGYSIFGYTDATNTPPRISDVTGGAERGYNTNYGLQQFCESNGIWIQVSHHVLLLKVHKIVLQANSQRKREQKRRFSEQRQKHTHITPPMLRVNRSCFATGSSNWN